MDVLMMNAAAFAAGIAGSMGLGGGFLLMIYMSYAGVPAEEARAVNLLFFLPTALTAMIINRRELKIEEGVLPYAAAAGAIGAVIGLWAAGSVEKGSLRTIFAVLMILVGLKEIFHKKEECVSEKESDAQKFLMQYER